MPIAVAGTGFTSDANFAETGLAGTVGVQIIDSTGAVVSARTTSGIIETPAASGNYLATLTAPSSAGDYQIAWDDGSGNYAVDEVTVTVGPTTFTTPTASDLCTLADVRAAMRVQAAFTDWDAQISDAISMASAAIIQEAQREFAPVSAATTRRFVVQRVPGAVVHFGPYDLQSATAVSLNPETTSPTTLTQFDTYSFEPFQSRSGTYKQLRMAPAAPIFSTVAVKYGYALVDMGLPDHSARYPPRLHRDRQELAR